MDKITWLPLKGEISIQNNNIEFNSKSYTNSKVRCNKMFRGGTIKFKVNIHSKNSNENPMMLFVGLNENTQYPKLHFGISSYGDFSISQNESTGWNKLDSTEVISNKNNYNNAVEFEILIEIIGSQAQFYANGVLVCKTDRAVLTYSQITLNLEGEGRITISNFVIETKQLSAFIVMDFSPEFEYIYTEVIRPICEELDVICSRADEYNYPGAIIKDILDSIRDSDIIIADITPDNPNVYLEVGYAYALGKNPILLMNKDRERLPFDISGFRVIMYDNTIKGAPHVRTLLTKFLETIINK